MRHVRTLAGLALLVAAAVAVLALVLREPAAPAPLPPSATDRSDPPADPLDGWSVVGGGARTNDGPASSVGTDRIAASPGRLSIRLCGDAATRRWLTVRRDVPARGLDRVTLRLLVRSRGVAASERPQASEAAATLVLLSGSGRQYELHATPAPAGDHEWTRFVLDTIAPHGTETARVDLSLTRPGTTWFDDVRLDVIPATAEDVAGRERAFDALAGHLRRTYPFFGLEGRPHADALFARHRAGAVESSDEEEFLEATRSMLSELDDPNVVIVAQGGWTTYLRRIRTAKEPDSTRNWNAPSIGAALTTTIASNSHYTVCGLVGDAPHAIGYVRIDWFGRGRVDVEELLDRLSDVRSLVVDVRDCSGGDESLAARIAGRFTATPVVYARSERRDPFAEADVAFLPPVDRVLYPASPGRADTRRVVVLQGPWCERSTEEFLLMMRALPNVTTIGLPSRGALADPAPFDLLPGVKVWSPRRRVILPDGECIEGKGVPPKILVEGPHGKADPTLERALAELR